MKMTLGEENGCLAAHPTTPRYHCYTRRLKKRSFVGWAKGTTTQQVMVDGIYNDDMKHLIQKPVAPSVD